MSQPFGIYGSEIDDNMTIIDIINSTDKTSIKDDPRLFENIVQPQRENQHQLGEEFLTTSDSCEYSLIIYKIDPNDTTNNFDNVSKNWENSPNENEWVTTYYITVNGKRYIGPSLMCNGKEKHPYKVYEENNKRYFYDLNFTKYLFDKNKKLEVEDNEVSACVKNLNKGVEWLPIHHSDLHFNASSKQSKQSGNNGGSLRKTKKRKHSRVRRFTPKYKRRSSRRSVTKHVRRKHK